MSDDADIKRLQAKNDFLHFVIETLQEKLAAAEQWDVIESQRNEKLQARVDKYKRALERLASDDSFVDELAFKDIYDQLDEDRIARINFAKSTIED